MSLGLNVPVITPFASTCFIDPYPAYWMAAAHAPRSPAALANVAPARLIPATYRI